jgi:hypothetical protein
MVSTTFDESQHRRNPHGKFADNPKAGVDDEQLHRLRTRDVIARGGGVFEVDASNVIEELDSDDGSTTTSISQSPAAMARMGATSRLIGSVSRPELESICGQQVSILRAGTTMLGGGVTQIHQVRLFTTSDGVLGALPKGKRSNGWRVDPSNVLAATSGWGKGPNEELAGLWAAADAEIPPTQTVTQGDLDKLPVDDWGEDNPDATFAAAVLCTHPGFDGRRQPGCVWMISTYNAEHDIADGYLWTPGGSGLESEHGSVYGKDLRAMSAAWVTSPGVRQLRMSDAFDLPADPAGVYALLR